MFPSTWSRSVTGHECHDGAMPSNVQLTAREAETDCSCLRSKTQAGALDPAPQVGRTVFQFNELVKWRDCKQSLFCETILCEIDHCWILVKYLKYTCLDGQYFASLALSIHLNCYRFWQHVALTSSHTMQRRNSGAEPRARRGTLVITALSLSRNRKC